MGRKRTDRTVEDTARKLARTFACETSPEISDSEVTDLLRELDESRQDPAEPDSARSREMALVGLATTFAAMRSAADVQGLVLDFFARHGDSPAMDKAASGLGSDAASALERVHRLLVGISQCIERSMPYAMRRLLAESSESECHVLLNRKDKTFTWETASLRGEPMPMRPVVLDAATRLAGIPERFAGPLADLVMDDLYSSGSNCLPNFARLRAARGNDTAITWIPPRIHVSEQDLADAERELRSEAMNAPIPSTTGAGSTEVDILSHTLPSMTAERGSGIDTILEGIESGLLHRLPIAASQKYSLISGKTGRPLSTQELVDHLKAIRANPAFFPRGTSHRPEEHA